MDTGAPFPDNSSILFGREPDLTELLSRIKHPGLTVVTARPQMGKTWLLQELGRQVTINEAEPHLVGYFESRSEGADSLLRALIDLYTRWLANTDYAAQANMVWQQNRGKLLTGVTDSVASVIEKLGDCFTVPGARLISKTLQGLTRSNTTLQSAGLQIQPLQYDQARDLVRTVRKITNFPLILILDGWEQSRTLDAGISILHAFLRHLAEWPRVHIIIGMRPEAPVITEIEKIIKDQPARSLFYHLPLMHLDEENKDARQALLEHVRSHISLEEALTDAELLHQIDGYPAVVNRWTDPLSAIEVDSVNTLKKLAEDAHANRFREFDSLLPELDKPGECQLAMRLALITSFGDEWWQQLKVSILNGLDEALLDDLRYKKILEQTQPPSFGHDKRWDAVRNWFLVNRNIDMTRQAKLLIHTFAAQITDTNEDKLPFSSLLLNLQSHQILSLPQICHALLDANGSLFGIRADKSVISELRIQDIQFKGGEVLLAMGLFNTLIAAKAEDELPRRDALLEELRQLATNDEAEPAVREQLAKGLGSTVISHSELGQIDLAEIVRKEFFSLAENFPEDDRIRELYSKLLVLIEEMAVNHDKETIPQD